MRTLPLRARLGKPGAGDVGALQDPAYAAAIHGAPVHRTSTTLAPLPAVAQTLHSLHCPAIARLSQCTSAYRPAHNRRHTRLCLSVQLTQSLHSTRSTCMWFVHNTVVRDGFLLSAIVLCRPGHHCIGPGPQEPAGSEVQGIPAVPVSAKRQPPGC